MNSEKENQEFREALGASDVNKFRGLTQVVIKENAFKKKEAKRLGLLYAGMAAAVLILILSWWLTEERSVDTEAIFVQYFIPPNAISLMRGVNQDQLSNSLLQVQKSVDSLYRIQEYAAAISVIAAFKKENPQIESSDYYFWLGVLQLLNNQATNAIVSIQNIKVGHTYDKFWYLALANLRAGNLSSAKAIFQNIAREEGPYQQSAQQVLRSL